MITIIGPTASGKTRLAAHLAHHIGSEVISADSRQVYRGMDLGTGKDLVDYQVGGTLVPYHLIDIMPAGSRYNLYQYQQDFHRVYQDIKARGIEIPILCGGTGLYVESILGGYHLADAPENTALRASLVGKSLEELLEILSRYPSRHNNKDIDTAQRAIRAIEIAEYTRQSIEEGQSPRYEPIPSTIFCLNLDRDVRRERISLRLKQRLEQGMTNEVERLLASGIAPDDLIYYGLEYKWLTLYVIGDIDLDTMITQLEIAIHQFAKRQMTWFRGMERRGYTLHYIDALAPMEDKIDMILKQINQ